MSRSPSRLGLTLLVLALGMWPAAVWAASNVLTWTDNADNETAQNLERGTAGSITQCPTAPFSALVSLPANVTSYTDVAVVPGVLYCYRLNAQNSAGTSSYSNVVGRLVPFSVPLAPSGLSASGGP